MLVDSAGIEHQFTFIISVITPSPEVICDTIYLNETVLFCPDSSEIGREFSFIDEICPEERTDAVSFEISDQCLEYTGFVVGRDTACIVACDDRGACDTTYFCFVVEKFPGSPTAVMDCDTTDKDVPIQIKIGANDTLFGNIQLPTIIEQPQGGTATVNIDGTVTYIQEGDFCDSEDRFIYEVCNENGCDSCLLYTSPSPRDATLSRMPSSA